MSQDPLKQQLPFITRDMLAFEHATAFDLEIITLNIQDINVVISGVTREGPFNFRFFTGSGADEVTRTFRIPDIPIFLSVDTTDSTIGIGDVWARIYLRANNSRILKLAAGYITSQTGIAWPNSNLSELTPQRGTILRQIVSDPAAGAQFSQTIGNFQQWAIKAISATLTTDANAANRRVHLTFRDFQDRHMMEVISDTVQTASLARTYTFAPFGVLPITNSDNDILVPIPTDIVLPADWDFVSSIENGQVGDDWSAITVWSEVMCRDS